MISMKIPAISYPMSLYRATGRTIEIDASDLVMKVGEQLIQWANDDESDNEENDGNDKDEHQRHL